MVLSGTCTSAGGSSLQLGMKQCLDCSREKGNQLKLVYNLHSASTLIILFPFLVCTGTLKVPAHLFTRGPSFYEYLYVVGGVSQFSAVVSLKADNVTIRKDMLCSICRATLAFFVFISL